MKPVPPDIVVRVLAPKRRGRFVYRWIDRDGQPRQHQSELAIKPANRREAEREAAALEEKLNLELAEELDLLWSTFERRYMADHLSGLAKNSADAWRTAANHLRNIVSPLTVSDVDAAALAKLAATLRRRELAESSIATYLRTIEAALGWAVDMGYLGRKPKVRKPKRAKGQSEKMRGRPLATEEFERMLVAAKTVRPDDSGDWQHILRGLWLSGLRIGEAFILSWDFTADFAVDLAGPSPIFRITAAGQKRAVNELLPMAPDFADWLEQVPPRQRRGRVFRFPVRLDTACKVISKIGNKAGIVVTPQGGTATAHDLRRSFGNRWASKVPAATLQRLMRHEDIKTTMSYYVALQADDIGAELRRIQKSGASGGASPALEKGEPIHYDATSSGQVT